MKSLLQCILVAYYTDLKRFANARITKKLDADIRSLCQGDAETTAIVTNCRKIAEAEKRRRRQSGLPTKYRRTMKRVPNAQHVPCRRAK